MLDERLALLSMDKGSKHALSEVSGDCVQHHNIGL